LQSNETPNCKYFSKTAIELPAAASMTLLLPQLSTSSQWTPCLSKSWTISMWPLNDAQCNGLGFIYFVVPITTCLFSGLT
jgi:hypothetical protein